MKRKMKELFKTSIYSMMTISDKTRIGRYFLEKTQEFIMSRVQSIQHQGVKLRFALPNSLNRFRVDTFSSKEPETLEWIDNIPRGSVIWDVGANIGLYTCYAAKARNCQVFAFEPSVFNLELLARNVFLNEIIDKVTVIPLPLSDTLTISTLNFTNTEWGGALSTFGQNYGHDGQQLNKVFEFNTVGLSITDAVERLNIPQPDYIKMDVDGIEHLILKGGLAVLSHVKGILIEINEAFDEQKISAGRYLMGAGLKLKERRHSDMFENSIYQNSYNQIWHR